MKKIIIVSLAFFIYHILPAQDKVILVKDSSNRYTAKKWSIGISVGTMDNRFSKSIENALYDAGYNKTIHFTNIQFTQPSSRGRAGFSIDFNRWINKYFTLSLNIDYNSKIIHGYNGYDFLEFDYKLFTFAPLVKFTPREFFFLGIGPLYCYSKKGSGLKLEGFEKFGMSLHTSIRSSNNTSRVFGYLELKYNLIGINKIGPYIAYQPINPDFPETKINFNNGYFGIGLGCRL